MYMRTLFTLLTLLSLTACKHTSNSLDQTSVLEQLYKQYDQWRGTPYQLGGMNQLGIDCSGFVMKTYSEKFGLHLPRTTEAQSQLLKKVKKQNLQAGDLVFFKIPDQGKRYHVGMFLENNQFLHASTSKGVIISDLQNAYWKGSYWKSVRIIK